MNSGFSEPSGRDRTEPNAHLPKVPRTEFPTRRSMRMMTSVSMLLRMIGAAIALSLVKGFGMLALYGPNVGDGPCDRRRRRRGWARQMGARARPLAADEISVRGRYGALAGSDGFAVSGQAHRASRFAPFEAGLSEELVEPFGNRIPLDCLRTRHHPGAHAGRNLAAARDGCGGAQIAHPAVGARSDEDPIDGRAGDRRSALETHIVESSFDRGAPCRIGNLAWIRDATVDADDMLRANAPGHLWNDFFNVDDDFLVEHRVGVARKLAPRRGRPLPHLALRRVGATADIFIRFLIRRDQAHFGAEFDRKIADGKTAFDRQIADRAAGIFDGVAGSAGSADVADQRQDEILGGHAERQSALEIDTHGFRSALDDGLRCQYMREFAGADPEGQCAQSTMRAGMAVPANDQAAGKAEAKFGPDDVDDALTGLVDIEHRNSAGRSFHPQRRQ